MAFGGTIIDRGSGLFLYSSGGGDIGDTFTPAEDDIILVASSHDNSTVDITAVAAANWNITFTEVTGSLWGSQSDRLGLWVGRVGASPTSDRVNITRSGAGNTRSRVIQITGCKTSGTAQSIFQQTSSVYEGYQGGGSPVTIDTFSSFQTDSLTLVLGHYEKSGASWATPSGYTEIYNDSGFNMSSVAYYNLNEDTTPNLEYTSLPNYVYLYGMAFEILAEAAAGTAVPIVMLNHNHFNGGL